MVLGKGIGGNKKIKATTEYQPIREFKKRSHDDDAGAPLGPSGSESCMVCSWPTFKDFWDKNYANIKVCKRDADTCTDCLMFLNAINFTPSTLPDIDNGEAVEEAMDTVLTKVEEKRQAAADHVHQYKTQRTLAIE